MRQPNLLLLTYLAQVRQLPTKNARLCVRHASITRHFLLIKHSNIAGISHKAIVITGIARVAAWVGQNKNTGEWLKVVGYWRKTTRFTSSQLLVVERK